ncbi:hypothetical protein EVAR_791_1 [Eumeta japonica]|uniref:Uncharacterized protein n=1 Tax=Eumeta variegata TaxID=151549 RepID=A0A4C1SC73_EUMVA|nr:hypothetical protein EVAR_791_1 [Eumeta japonica]
MSHSPAASARARAPRASLGTATVNYAERADFNVGIEPTAFGLVVEHASAVLPPLVRYKMFLSKGQCDAPQPNERPPRTIRKCTRDACAVWPDSKVPITSAALPGWMATDRVWNRYNPEQWSPTLSSSLPPL